MKFKILLLVVLLIPFVSSAQVYQNSYEANKAAYEKAAMKQCGKPSCVPDTEPDVVVIETVEVQAAEATVSTTSEAKVEVLENENEQLKTQIALLQQLISLLKTLAGLKQ